MLLHPVLSRHLIQLNYSYARLKLKQCESHLQTIR